MPNIKLSIPFADRSILRQTPGGTGVWKDNRFLLNEPTKYCDAWVVYEGLIKKEESNCNPENTILITGEPYSIKKYNKRFLRQFGTIITSQSEIKGKNVIHSQTSLPWNVGKVGQEKKILKLSKNYDELKKGDLTRKTKFISIVTSDKKYTQGHRDRLDFIYKLQEHFKDKLDIFGPGLGVNSPGDSKIKFKYHNDKWDALSGYKYHIVIENSSHEDYWTEKLSDAYLAGTYPFYYGCKNLEKYFPTRAYTEIDINKPEEAIKIIEDKIAENSYENSKQYLEISRNMVLDKYNLFSFVHDIIKSKLKTEGHTKNICLRPENEFKYISNIIKKIKKVTREAVKKLL